MHVKNLLKLPAHKREDSHIKFLSQYFRKVTFFEKLKMDKLDPEVQNKCFRVMQFEEHPCGEVLFNFGDEGDLFYVILKGQVSVEIPIPCEVEMT